MSTLPSVSIDQFRSAGVDLLDAIRSGGSVASQPARVGVDLCLVLAYPLQWLRDRQSVPIPPDPSRPIFGVRGDDDDVDLMADVLQSIAQEVDGDNFANAIMAGPVGGPMVDWIIKEALRSIIAWISQQGMEDVFGEIIDWIISQLN